MSVVTKVAYPDRWGIGVDGALPPVIVSPRQGISTSITPSALMLTWRVPASTSGTGAESMLNFIAALRITGW